MLVKRCYLTSAMSYSPALFWHGGQANRENITAFETCTACARWQTPRLPFIPIPFLPKDTSVFSNRPHQTHLLQSNMMDKSWREKSSLMCCSVRVKHSIANLQAATQEQNVIISSQDQTSANLSNIRESWISFHAAARPLLRPNLSPTPPALLW